jgi:hypothetical protein
VKSFFAAELKQFGVVEVSIGFRSVGTVLHHQSVVHCLLSL